MTQDLGVRRTAESDTPATGFADTSGRWPFLWYFLGSLLGAVMLLRRSWADPGGVYLSTGGMDQVVNEWFFSVVADKVMHLDNPLMTDLQNAPDGVNMMANPAIFGLSVPLAPLTLAFGASFTVLLVTTVGIAASTTAWFWLLRRSVVPATPWAAGVAALLLGFGPAIITHVNGPRPQLVISVLLPLIIDRMLQLCRGELVRRNGIILGLLTTYQVLIGEELLFIAAIGCALFAAGYCWARPSILRTALRPLVSGLALGGALATALLAYPLYWQFAGDGSYGHLFYTPASGPRAFVTYPAHSLGGNPDAAVAVAQTPDQNAFFGWTVLLLAGVLAAVLWRSAVGRGAVVLAVGAGLLSLGSTIPLPGDASMAGPWQLVGSLPLFDSLIETRMAIACLPGLAVLLALGLERIFRMREGTTRVVGLGVVAVAFVPLVPTPLPVAEWTAPPAFIADGGWRDYIRPGQSLVTFPLASQTYQEPLHWQVSADLGFAIPGGYFVGPSPYVDVGIYGAGPRPTSDLFNTVNASGVAAEVTDQVRAAALADFAYWHADAVMIPPGVNAEAKRLTLERIFGHPGDLVGGVLVWRAGG